MVMTHAKVNLTLPLVVLAYFSLVQFMPHYREAHNLLLILGSLIILYDFHRIDKRAQLTRIGLYILICLIHFYSYSLSYELSSTDPIIYGIGYIFSLFMWLWILKRTSIN